MLDQILIGLSELALSPGLYERAVTPFAEEAALAFGGAAGYAQRREAGLQRLESEVRRLVEPDGPWGEHLPSTAVHLRYQADLVGLWRPGLRGARVLDAGCGDAFNLLLMSVLGADRATGVDVDAGRVALAREAIAALPPEHTERIDARVGDVGALPADDASVDLLVSNEAVGVYLDLDAFLREAARVVRPGGAVVIAEANTAINPMLRRRSIDLWEGYERGPAPSVVHGHRIEYPYVDEREAVVREALPGVDLTTARRIAENTARMTSDEVRAACAAYRDRGVEPAQPYRRGQIPVAPAGMVVERPVDPHRLARSLAALGFETRVRGYWGGANGSRPIRVANRVLSAAGRWLVWTAPAFRVVGRRPAAP